MNIKQLEKANHYLQQIKILDAQIIEIEKHAILVANGEVEINLKLTTRDLAKKKDEESKVGFDEDGSLLATNYRSASDWMSRYFNPLSSFASGGLMGGCHSLKPNNHETTYSAEIKENAALQILGVILCARQQEREILLSKLNKMGIAA